MNIVTSIYGTTEKCNSRCFYKSLLLYFLAKPSREYIKVIISYDRILGGNSDKETILIKIVSEYELL